MSKHLLFSLATSIALFACTACTDNATTVEDPDPDSECTRNKDCTDEDKPICNEHGKCVADNDIAECTRNKDCTDESKPICSDGKCVKAPECYENNDCSNKDKPICDDGTCVSKSEVKECTKSADCTESSKPYCKNGVCTKAPDCYENDDCTPDKPICNDGKCIAKDEEPECSDDKDCTNESKPVCSNGTCVAKQDTAECHQNSDCKDSSKPVCDNGTCVAKQDTAECHQNSDCKDESKPVCSNGTCIAKQDTAECHQNSDCKDTSKPVCSNEKCIAKPEWVADILDVVFNEDGTAKNIAPTDITVVPNGTKPTVTYNEVLGHNVATFHNDLGKAASSYYKADYTGKEDIKAKIADGHTLEAVIKLNVKDDGSVVTHFFSSTESGGTGFLVSGKDSGTSMTFLPYVGSDYVSASSGVTPSKGIYYHVVGVYDKSKEKASIYINGELKKQSDAKGDFKFGSETWFGIGADAITGGSEAAWDGDIAIARVYSDPLSADRIKQLYEESKISAVPVEIPFDISDVDCIGNVRVSHGYKYYFYGQNFVDGDYVRFVSLSNDKEYKANATVQSDRLVVIIPDNLVTDRYKSVLVRGNKTAELARGKIIVSKDAPRTTHPRIVAHMGDIEWKYEGTEANSIANLKRAQEIDAYAVELDLRMSSDGVLVVSHDSKINGVSIASNSIATLEKQHLPNGEKLPRFSEFLDVAKQKPTVRLLVDVKYLDTIYTMIDKGIALVAEKGMQDQVDWLIGAYSISQKTKKRADAAPNATVMQLIDNANSDAPIESLLADDIVPGYNYNYTSKYNATTIKKLHDGGGIVAVYTPDTKELIQKQINLGVDAITTDLAKDALKMVKVYAEK